MKPLRISFEVIYQFSKKDFRAYSNITIASVLSFPYYESAEAFLSKDPAVSKMEVFGTLVNRFQSLFLSIYLSIYICSHNSYYSHIIEWQHIAYGPNSTFGRKPDNTRFMKIQRGYFFGKVAELMLLSQKPQCGLKQT